MKTFIALAASFAVNLTILGTLEWSAYQAQTPPAGEVIVSQAPDEAALLAYKAPEKPELLAYKRGRAAQLLL
jgi:hypothetical protein